MTPGGIVGLVNGEALLVKGAASRFAIPNLTERRHASVLHLVILTFPQLALQNVTLPVSPGWPHPRRFSGLVGHCLRPESIDSFAVRRPAAAMPPSAPPFAGNGRYNP
jgi:hypothetical protein